MAANQDWKSGPPPSKGWWPTKTLFSEAPENFGLRWWNGFVWSGSLTKQEGRMFPANTINTWAGIETSTDTDRILWQSRPKSWPARSKT